MLNILVVDDSSIYRRIVVTAVELTRRAKAIETAQNGLECLDKISKFTYDAVLLDVNMPELDGISTLQRIRKKDSKLPVIMVSGVGGKNAEITLKALELGAVDFIVKPLEENYEKNLDTLRKTLVGIFENIINQKKSLSHKVVNTNGYHMTGVSHKISKVDLVLIASSTGGPVALEKVISNINGNFSKPILIVQHMPPEFTKVMADTLDRKGSIRVIEGKNGDILRAGQAIVAPGGFHMIVNKTNNINKIVQMTEDGFVNGVRPAADVLFKSVAEVLKGSKVLVIVLTGMGNDGLEGVRVLKNSLECYCIAQSERTCIVYGMPRCIVDAGLADEIVDIENIGKRLSEIALVGS